MEQSTEQYGNKMAWKILTTRMGEDIENPLPEEVIEALEELYQVIDSSEVADKGYEEHPNTWLRYGFDGGPLYVLDIYRGGLVYFSKYADPDYRGLISEQKMESISYEEAVTLFLYLLEDRLNEIESQPWTDDT